MMHFIKSVHRKLLLALVFALNSCDSSNESTLTNETTLRFEGAPSSVLSVSSPHVIKDALVLTPNSSNLFAINTESSKQLRVSSPIPIELIIHPDDQLLIDLRGNQPVFSGPGSKLNQTLFDYKVERDRILSTYGDIYDWGQVMDLTQFLDRLDSIESKIHELQGRYNHETVQSNEIMQEWMQLQKAIVVGNLLTSYGMIQQHLDLTLLRSRFDALLPRSKSLEKFPLYADLWSNNTLFLYIQQPYYQQEIFDISSHQIIEALLKFEKDDFSSQLMLAHILRKDLSSFETESYEKYRSEINEKLEHIVLKSAVANAYKEAQQHINTEGSLLENAFVGSYDVDVILDQILEENKGNIIYMDIWATWCKPCLEEFKLSRAFKSNFSNDEITYMYVAAQSQEKAWRAMVNKFKLEGTHLLLNDTQFEAFTKRYEIGYFPSYYIIDQKGSVLNQKANLSPSHPETVDMIKSLLDHQ
jgi:thiol-disulfide isomerase/thioredoxin